MRSALLLSAVGMVRLSEPDLLKTRRSVSSSAEREFSEISGAGRGFNKEVGEGEAQ